MPACQASKARRTHGLALHVEAYSLGKTSPPVITPQSESNQSPRLHRAPGEPSPWITVGRTPPAGRQQGNPEKQHQLEPGLAYKQVCVCVRCSVVSDSLQLHGLESARLLWPWNSPGKNTGVGCHFLLQISRWLYYLVATLSLWPLASPLALSLNCLICKKG